MAVYHKGAHAGSLSLPAKLHGGDLTSSVLSYFDYCYKTKSYLMLNMRRSTQKKSMSIALNKSLLYILLHAEYAKFEATWQMHHCRAAQMPLMKIV